MLTINDLAGVGNVTTDDPAVPLVLNDIYNVSLTTGTLNIASRTMVNVTPISVAGYNRFQVQVKGGTAEVTILAGYLGQLTGTYSFAATPTQILWNGSGSVTLPAGGGTALSDTLTFTPSGTGPLCLAFDVSSNATSLYVHNSLGTGYAFYYKTGTGASTVSKSGYTAAGTQRNVLSTLVKAGTI